MGNCINRLFSPAHQKAKVVLICNEGEKEFRGSTLVKEVPSCGPHHNGYELVHYSLLPPSPSPSPSSRTEPGTGTGGEAAGCLLPHLMHPQDHHSISLKITKKESCQGRSIRILVSRQQLEFLLRDANMFRSTKIAIRPSRTFNRGNRKWRPSLSAIPELHDF